MRPGKLFKIHSPGCKLYPPYRDFNEKDTQHLPHGTLFMVLSVKPPESISNYYDIHHPWLVLVGTKTGLIEILNLYIEDVTPFT